MFSEHSSAKIHTLQVHINTFLFSRHRKYTTAWHKNVKSVEQIKILDIMKFCRGQALCFQSIPRRKYTPFKFHINTFLFSRHRKYTSAWHKNVKSVEQIKILDIMKFCRGQALWQWTCNALTYWGRDKMNAILQTIFFTSFFKWKLLFSLDWNFTEVCFQRSNWQKAIIGSDNGLAPNRRQAIIWTNGGLVYGRIYASHGLNKLSYTWDVLYNSRVSSQFFYIYIFLSNGLHLFQNARFFFKYPYRFQHSICLLLMGNEQ